MPELLERSGQLASLAEALAAARRGPGGALVLLAGEAGGGKTALLRRFCANAPATDIPAVWGSCDPLFTPRPLGPFLDIAHDVGGELAELVADGGKPHQIAAALTREAERRPGLVIVVEDLHWSDEATLDVLSLLGRRIESIPALVLATYRDDQVDRGHPLRQLLGELGGSASIRRLTLPPLSVTAVATLAERSGVDPVELHRATAGNPFFVTEVLADDRRDDDGRDLDGRDLGEIPPTVRDAVLARAARLAPAATAVLEAVSVAPPQAELWLLDALLADPDGLDALDACLGAGILEAAPGGVAFRHELARLAVEESVPPHRRIRLHRAALRALADPPAGSPDLARLAHHAEAAGDEAAVLRHAPAAAQRAASIGAHREAAAQYARALRFAQTQPAPRRAALLEGRSYECYITDQADESVAALREAVQCHRDSGDRRGEGAALSLLSRRLWCRGHAADAAKAGHEAVALLEELAPGPELALAYSNLGQVYLNEECFEQARDWSSRALALAERWGDTAVVVHSLNNLGTIELLQGDRAGLSTLDSSLALAEKCGLEEHIGRVFIHAGWALTRTRAYDLAPWLDRGIGVCEELGLESWKLYVQAYRARADLDRGRFDEALHEATAVRGCAQSSPLLLILGLTVIGLVQARRGSADPWPALDEARALAAGQNELQYLAPVAAARAEAAWLDGRGSLVDAETRDALDLAVARRSPWVVGELIWLRHLAGGPGFSTVDSGRSTMDNVALVAPYAQQLAGDPGAAALAWTRLECPYDAALALAASHDEHQLRTALAQFQRLGARAATTIVARTLREHGVRDLPRGPRAETASNPARLTRREAEVLTHLRQGSSNAEIATRLYLSEKTVHHHVSAVLRKLGVSSRGQAVSVAAQLGMPAQPQSKDGPT